MCGVALKVCKEFVCGVIRRQSRQNTGHPEAAMHALQATCNDIEARRVCWAAFKLCAACKLAAYCCKAQQASDWPAHRDACAAARAARTSSSTQTAAAT
jgi:hypothetical protein